MLERFQAWLDPVPTEHVSLRGEFDLQIAGDLVAVIVPLARIAGIAFAGAGFIEYLFYPQSLSLLLAVRVVFCAAFFALPVLKRWEGNANAVFTAFFLFVIGGSLPVGALFLITHDPTGPYSYYFLLMIMFLGTVPWPVRWALLGNCSLLFFYALCGLLTGAGHVPLFLTYCYYLVGCFCAVLFMQRQLMRLRWASFFSQRQVNTLNTRLETDLKTQQRLAAELAVARESAESANRAKSAFVANMSHELRTPLNAVLGFARLLSRGKHLDADQQECIRTISSSGTHLLSLINDILDMSRIEAGRVELVPEHFDLREMLAALQEMFRLKAEEKNLSLLIEVSVDFPQYVRTDAAKLRQVLVNLLGNAMKFTREGGVALRARCQSAGTNRVQLFFEVEDSGIGMDEGEIAQIFEPFVQSHSSSAWREGTGLGLAISRTYVGLLGGTIAVHSAKGKGSRFSFDVSAELSTAADVAPTRPRRRIVGIEPGQPSYRLVVADDRDSNRALLVKLLAPLGFEIRGVRNGAECVALWEQWQPHLIWMDMRMPVMDGHEATRRIRSSAQGHGTAIIALTASAFENDRHLVLSEGCDDFVRKPFVEEEIFQRLEKYLGVRFITEEEQAVDGTPPIELRAEQLSTTDASWRKELRKAALAADYDRLQALTAELRPRNADAANALEGLVHAFQYEKILAALEASQPPVIP